MFSGLGFTSVQCGEISYHSGAMALTLPCQAKIRLAFGKASGGEAVSGVVVKGKLAQGKGSGIMLIAKERPESIGITTLPACCGALTASNRVGIAALCEKGEQNRVYSIRRISDGKAVFGEDSIMAGMIEKALINGASGVKAVKAGTEESFDYEAALAARWSGRTIWALSAVTAPRGRFYSF